MAKQTGPISLYIDEHNVINLKYVITTYWSETSGKKFLHVILAGEPVGPDADACPGYKFKEENGKDFIEALIDFHELEYSRKKP